MRKNRGRTESAQGETQDPAPQLPHERDESVEATAPTEPVTRQLGQLAHQDASRGVPDTSKSAETDATYHRLREEEQGPGLSPPAPSASRR